MAHLFRFYFFFPLVALFCGAALHAGEGTLGPDYDLAKSPGSGNGAVQSRGYGEEAGDGLGRIIRTGDVNGDGRDDMVVGSDVGKIYVWLGSPNLPDRFNPYEFAAAGRPATTISGFAALWALTVGDVNGDGKDDIIMGYRPNERGAGNMAIILGRESVHASINLNPNVGQEVSVVIFSGSNPDGLSSDGAITLGDLNGDSLPDIIVGVPLAKRYGRNDPVTGAVHVIFGRANFPSGVDLDAQSGSISIGGIAEGDALTEGGAVHAADVNGDGKDDLIMAAPGAIGRSGQPSAGQIYVIFGHTDFASYRGLDLRSQANVTIFGEKAGDALTRGGDLTSGDVNGDGKQDVLISAPQAFVNGQSNVGQAYVVFGRTTFPSILNLAPNQVGSADMRIRAHPAPDNLAANGVLKAGDINDDGADDILISTHAASGNTGGSEAGRVYIILGRKSPATLPPVVELGTSNPTTKADVVIHGARHGDHLTQGGSLMTGDANGDGFNDIILGSNLTLGSNDSSRDDAGRAYIVYGRTTFAPLLDLRQEYGTTRGADVQLRGAFAGDGVTEGGAMVFGDLTGDGHPELIIGGPKVDRLSDGLVDAGGIFVLQGVGRAEIVVLDPSGAEVKANPGDFPLVNLGQVGMGAMVSFNFTVKNSGREPIYHLDAYLQGGDHDLFEIPTSALPSTLPPKTSVPLEILFTPKSLGIKTVKIEIPNSDSDEGFFVIRVQVEVVKAVPPVVRTLPADAEITTAALAGLVSAKGHARRVFFDYGLTKNYEHSVEAELVPVNPPVETRIATTVTGLLPHTKYHYRIRAASLQGAATGANATFTTKNSDPTVAHDGYSVTNGSVLTLDVLANDEDPDGDALSLASFTQAKVAGKTVGKIAKAGNALIFTVPQDFTTLAPEGATFNYEAKDAFGGVTATTGTLFPAVASLDSEAKTMPSISGEYSIQVTTEGRWSITETAAWVTTGAGTEAEPNKATITVQANTSINSRIAIIKIAGQTHTLTQVGVIQPSIALPKDGVPLAKIMRPYELLIVTTFGPVTYAVTPKLPTGLTMNPATGLISGMPTVAGTYPVTIKAKNAAAAADEVLSFNIVVQGLPDNLAGTYIGFVAETGSIHCARLDVTVTPGGAVSGKVTSVTGTKSFATTLVSKFEYDNQPPGPDPEFLTAVIPYPSTEYPDGVIHLQFSPVTQSFFGTYQDSGPYYFADYESQITGWRNGWKADTHPATAHAGLNTFMMPPAVGFASSIPQGYGYGSFTVAASNGALTVSGKLADNSDFLTAGFIGQEGQILLFQPLYGKKGWLGGVIQRDALSQESISQINSVSNFEPLWMKPESPAAARDTIYGNGFDPILIQVEGGPYTPPAKGGVVMGLPNEDNNASLNVVLSAEFGDYQEAWYGLNVRNSNAKGILQKVTSNASAEVKFAMPTLNAATGAFAGSFVVVDSTPSKNRPVKFKGLIVNVGGTLSGYGFYLIPNLPTAAGETLSNTPKLSQPVRFWSGPPP